MYIFIFMHSRAMSCVNAMCQIPKHYLLQKSEGDHRSFKRAAPGGHRILRADPWSCHRAPSGRSGKRSRDARGARENPGTPRSLHRCHMKILSTRLWSPSGIPGPPPGPRSLSPGLAATQRPPNGALLDNPENVHVQLIL